MPSAAPSPPSARDRLGARWGALVVVLVLGCLVGACALSFARPLVGVPLLISALGVAGALLSWSARREREEDARRRADLVAVAPPEGRAWRVLLTHLGHGAHVEAIAEQARWALRPETTEGTGRSQLGGEPLLPRGHDWPTHGTAPLAFVAQLELAELRAALARDDDYRTDRHARWVGPPEGLLSFFVSDAIWEHPEDPSNGQVLFFPGESELVRAPFPGALADGDRYRSRAVRFVAYEDPPIETIPVDDEEGRAALGEVRAYLGGAEETQVHGHASIIQVGMEERCEQIARGLSTDRPLAGPLADEVRAGSTRWRLLLQVGEPSLGMSWGDGGLLYFWITLEDLQAGRFDRVIALVEGH